MTINTIQHKKMRGFALLEAMLALFVLTIGILGVAGMQTQAMQSGSIAVQRMGVALKTQELIERMMANPGLTTVTRTQNAATNNVTVTTSTADDVVSYFNAGAGTDHGCSVATACTPAQIAEQDVFDWQSELNAILPADPAPVYTITVDDTTRDVVIDVTWSDRGNEYSYTVTTQIQPLVIDIQG